MGNEQVSQLESVIASMEEDTMTQAQVMYSVFLRDIYNDPRRFMLHSGKFLSILALLHRLFSCQCTLVASVGLTSRASASHTLVHGRQHLGRGGMSILDLRRLNHVFL